MSLRNLRVCSGTTHKIKRQDGKEAGKMVVPLVFYLGEGCLAAEIGAKLLSLLMGICFLDAARFSNQIVLV